MLSAIGSALVAGSIRTENTMSKRVKAVRGFFAHTENTYRAVKVGETVEVSDSLARELIASNKAESAPAEAPAKADKGK